MAVIEADKPITNVSVKAEQFAFAKLISNKDFSPSPQVVARSYGLREEDAKRVVIAASLGSESRVEHVTKAYGFLITSGQAVGVLYQSMPDPRGTRYLASHYVLVEEQCFRQLGSNFRYLIELLPVDIPIRHQYESLPTIRRELQRNRGRERKVIQRALEQFGPAGTLKRLLESYFTGVLTAHLAFSADVSARLDLLEALILLVPPALRRNASFATEIISPEGCQLRIRFVPRPMVGLRGHLIVRWSERKFEITGGRWENDEGLRQCCSFFEQFMDLQMLDKYLMHIDHIELAKQTSEATITDWVDVLSRFLHPILTGERYRRGKALSRELSICLQQCPTALSREEFTELLCMLVRDMTEGKIEPVTVSDNIVQCWKKIDTERFKAELYRICQHSIASDKDCAHWWQFLGHSLRPNHPLHGDKAIHRLLAECARKRNVEEGPVVVLEDLVNLVHSCLIPEAVWLPVLENILSRSYFKNIELMLY